MFYGTEEERRQAAEKEIQSHRDAAALCARIKPILARFDCKVYNVRLERALCEEGRIFCRKEYNRIDIYTLGGYHNHQNTLVSVALDAALDGKRIIAEKFIDSANSHREQHLREAYEIEDGLKSVAAYKHQLATLTAQINAIRDSIPYTIRDIYNLNHHVRTC